MGLQELGAGLRQKCECEVIRFSNRETLEGWKDPPKLGGDSPSLKVGNFNERKGKINRLHKYGYETMDDKNTFTHHRDPHEYIREYSAVFSISSRLMLRQKINPAIGMFRHKRTSGSPVHLGYPRWARLTSSCEQELSSPISKPANTFIDSSSCSLDDQQISLVDVPLTRHRATEGPETTQAIASAFQLKREDVSSAIQSAAQIASSMRRNGHLLSHTARNPMTEKPAGSVMHSLQSENGHRHSLKDHNCYKIVGSSGMERKQAACQRRLGVPHQGRFSTDSLPTDLVLQATTIRAPKVKDSISITVSYSKLSDSRLSKSIMDEEKVSSDSDPLPMKTLEDVVKSFMGKSLHPYFRQFDSFDTPKRTLGKAELYDYSSVYKSREF